MWRRYYCRLRVALGRIWRPTSNFKCALARCKPCPFIHNVDKILGSKRPFTITDRFKCTYACIMIYCSTCTLSKNVIHVRVGRKLGDSADILEMLKEIDKDASKSVACHYNLANYYTNQNRAVSLFTSVHRLSLSSQQGIWWINNKLFHAYRGHEIFSGGYFADMRFFVFCGN